VHHAALAVFACAIALPAAPVAARQVAVPAAPVAARQVAEPAIAGDSVPRLACPMPVAIPRGHDIMPVVPLDSTRTYTMPVAPPKCSNPLAQGPSVRLEPPKSKSLLDGLDYGFRPVPKAKRGGSR
jgi:hypothetical protein